MIDERKFNKVIERLAPDSSPCGWDPRFAIPEELGIQYDSAEFFLQQGFYNRALSEISGLERKLPEHPEVLELAGIIHAYVDDNAGALIRLEKALHFTPKDNKHMTGGVLMNTAGCYMKINRFDKAKDLLKMAIDCDNTNYHAFANLGMISHKEEKYEEAIPFYEASINGLDSQKALSNALAGAVVNLLDCYKMTKRTEDAKKLAERFKSLPQPEHVYVSVREGDKRRIIFYNRLIEEIRSWRRE